MPTAAKLEPTTRAASAKAETARRLGRAVHRSAASTRSGMLERAFTFAFRGLVYPQIWEDPVVDMKAHRKPTELILGFGI